MIYPITQKILINKKRVIRENLLLETIKTSAFISYHKYLFQVKVGYTNYFNTGMVYKVFSDFSITEQKIILENLSDAKNSIKSKMEKDLKNLKDLV